MLRVARLAAKRLEAKPLMVVARPLTVVVGLVSSRNCPKHHWPNHCLRPLLWSPTQELIHLQSQSLSNFGPAIELVVEAWQEQATSELIATQLVY